MILDTTGDRPRSIHLFQGRGGNDFLFLKPLKLFNSQLFSTKYGCREK